MSKTFLNYREENIMSLLTLENIHKEYASRILLNGVNLAVHRGERLALVGANGCGKTTLLRIAMNTEYADRGRVIVGRGIRVGYLSQDLEELSSEASNTALEYEKVAKLEAGLRSLEREMSQIEDETSLRAKMKEYTRLTEEYESLDGYNVETRIKSTLLGLGLREESLTIPIEKLSGGERMRVALARILLEEPDLLVLDEPTNHLDIKAVEWLENFLRGFGGGVLIVSHDRYFLDQVSTRIAELQQGSVIERSGNYSSYINQKEIRREFVLREKKRLQRKIKQTDELSKKLMSMHKVKAAKSREKEKLRLISQYDSQRQIGSSEHLKKASGPILNLRRAKHVSSNIAWADKLSKNFGTVELFSQASFKIHGGERIGIIGPNGCGKTTLLNILLGKDNDFQGEARLGHWVKYGYVGQEISFEDEGRTILQEILNKKEMLEGEAKKYLARYQFYGDEVNKKIEVLSGGEKVRVYLACLMLEEPYCLIMDEPTNHLDMPARDALESSLLDFRGTVIAISHDRYFLNRCVNRILEISAGKIHSYLGNYDDYKALKNQNQSKEKIQDAKDKAKAARTSKENKAPNQRQSINIREIEEEIAVLEAKMKDIEDSFGPQTGFEVYKIYDELSSQLASLYKKWESAAAGDS